MVEEGVYTPEEIGHYLKIPVSAVQREISAGKLKAKNFGGYLRVSHADFILYMKNATSDLSIVEAPKDEKTGWLRLEPGSAFDYTWPDGKTVEHFRNVLEGTASHAGREYHVKLGFTVREAAGRPRSRCLVLIDRYATVEFTKADDGDRGGPVAGIIKGRNNKHVPATATPPAEYEGLTVGAYREVVDGPYASHGLAVICGSDDFETMVKHALIQYGFREERWRTVAGSK